jgi:hypothetical protein
MMLDLTAGHGDPTSAALNGASILERKFDICEIFFGFNEFELSPPLRAGLRLIGKRPN